MAKKKPEFITLKPIPGGRYDQWLQKKKAKKAKLPKNSDDLLDKFTDKFGTDNVVNMTEVDLGDYTYAKGINHSLNVNVGRNIPNSIDALKPVERRILYSMYTTGVYKNKFEKVASISGTVVARFHPHGDMSVSDTLYRLGRSRSMMIPYIKPGVTLVT